MNIIGIIPVKYEYEDFPGIGLSMVAKKTLVRIAYELAKKSPVLKEVYIVSDHDTIIKHAQSFKANTLKLDSAFENHTQAVCKAFSKLKSLKGIETDAVMHIHFNEPRLDSEYFERLAENTALDSIACLAYKTIKTEVKQDFGVLPVTLTENHQISSFSTKADQNTFDLPGTKCFGKNSIDYILSMDNLKNEIQIFDDCLKKGFKATALLSEKEHAPIFNYNDLIKFG